MTPDYTVTKYADNFWNICEGGFGGGVDAYLLVGAKRAALIDALQGKFTKSLARQVRELTALPVDVLITHGHPDHMGAETAELLAAEGFTVYLSALDLPCAQGFAPGLDYSRVRDIPDGKVFDLGGIELESILVPGHTPGSMLFLDRAGGRCFTGDVFGVWLQIDHCLPVSTYLESLRRLPALFAEIPETVMYGGHKSQLMQNKLCVMLSDMTAACEAIAAGEAGEPVKPFPGQTEVMPLMRGALILKRGVATVTYRAERV